MGTLISYHHNRSVRHHGDPVTSFGRMLNSSAALATASSPSFASMMPRCSARARRISTDHHGRSPPSFAGWAVAYRDDAHGPTRVSVRETFGYSTALVFPNAASLFPNSSI